LEIYYTIKQYSVHTECLVVKSVHKQEVTIHFTREDTFHRGHPLHGVISNYICCSLYLKRNGMDVINKITKPRID
jgi:hypothetical protein